MDKKIFIVAFSLLLAGGGCNKTPQNSNLLYCSPQGELLSTPTMQSQRNYCLQTQKEEPTPNQPIDYTFAIIDDKGEKLKDSDLAKNTGIEVTILRKNLTEFGHFSPKVDPETGYVTLSNLTFTEPGSYTISIQFTPKDKDQNVSSITLKEEIAVGDTSQELQ